jgi:L-lactate dehydrogenase complex protein LldG
MTAPEVTAREEVLGRVRAAISASGQIGELPPALPTPAPPPRAKSALDLLRERLIEVGARVEVVAPDGVAAAISASCEQLGARRLVVPDDWPPQWLPASVECSPQSEHSVRSLASVEATATAARLGIAETGTIVFDGGAAQGSRLLSLLPELHVCVLRTDDIVPTFAAAMEQLEPSQGSAGALTFVSGPSATTDIELTRVEGVHGPRKLAVVLIAASI